MNDIMAAAERNQKRAWDVVRASGIVAIWESIGAQVHLVGSLKTGLLIKNLDVDFHIYSDPFVRADSFAAMAQLGRNDRIRRIEYVNLLDTDEVCLEWHASYRDIDGELWQIDMIHMPSDAPYAGYFETVADRVLALLTAETKAAILAIKNEIPKEQKVMGIEVCKAVMADGIRAFDDFMQWRQDHAIDGILDWMP